MHKNSNIPVEVKLNAVKDYLNSKKSCKQLANELNVDYRTIYSWVQNHKSLGISGITVSSTNSSYSVELKTSAVKDYLSSKGSLNDICKKYGIRSNRQLRNWISKYNSHEKIESYRAGGSVIMTKGRNTTFDERIDIVKYCIEQNRNYNKTAEKFQVSYQQIRGWVIKFDKFGIDALVDRRGKCKNESELTELEKLKSQNRLLEAKNSRLEMENEILKKLEELERRRY